jgi:hypothetical protein
MKRNLSILTFLSILYLTLCGCGGDGRKAYNSINLYFSPAEDYLLNQEIFPDFINYPDDRVKLGLRGNVKEVDYSTPHILGNFFNKEGKLQAKIFIATGGEFIEANIYEHAYNDSGHLLQIMQENRVNFGDGFRSVVNGKKAIDKITAHTASGKPLIRAINDVNRDRVDYIVRYEYDENDICRGVRLTDDSPNKKDDAIVCKFTCDEKGLITYLHVRRIRIPYRYTLGERKITPSYNSKGQLVSMKEISIPHNMEAYRIDSIASTTNYKYNRHGDIIECVYSDIVYPDNTTTDFILTFAYEYDQQENWIKKHIIGDITALDAAMNSYYRDSCPINRIDGKDGEGLGEIVIEREITYFETRSNASASRSKNKTSQASPAINIPATTGFISEAHYQLKRITNAERRELGIDAIEKYDIKSYPNRALAKGKEIYDGEKGRLETIIVIVEDHAIMEYLVSYDTSGNIIDCIPIGEEMPYRGDSKSVRIEGNKVRNICSWGEPGEWGEGICQIYTITDNLRFVPFAWPSSSYPFEVPFMTHEKSDDYFEESDEFLLFCDIESVTYTGTSGNQYTFVIKGKSKKDCRKLKAAQRTFMLEPLDNNFELAGEAIKAVMPAVRENETFEIKVKGLAKNKSDEKKFVRFEIKR